LVIQGESADGNNYMNIRFKGDMRLDGTFEYILWDCEADLSEIEAEWKPLNTLVLETEGVSSVYLYLRHTIQSVLINTGFYDNRTLIGEVDYDEEWYFEPTILVSDG
jgi:aconitase B